MDPAWFDHVRREHREVLDEVDRLHHAGLHGERLGAALDAFFAFERTRLRPLFVDEERTLGPLLDEYLPAEVAGSATLRREHETVRALVDGLREAADRVDQSADARADAEALIDDLVLLLHHHVRREDSVLNPLLQRLESRHHE